MKYFKCKKCLSTTGYNVKTKEDIKNILLKVTCICGGELKQKKGKKK